MVLLEESVMKRTSASMPGFKRPRLLSSVIFTVYVPCLLYTSGRADDHVSRWDFAGSNPVSAILENIMQKHGVFFISGLRPTGSRGFGCDRCRGQEEGAAKGEETGSVPTDQREGEQTTMFRGGTSQVQILSPQF